MLSQAIAAIAQYLWVDLTALAAGQHHDLTRVGVVAYLLVRVGIIAIQRSGYGDSTGGLQPCTPLLLPGNLQTQRLVLACDPPACHHDDQQEGRHQAGGGLSSPATYDLIPP